LVVFESAVVGLTEVLQHIPRAVTVVPPSEVTLPPEDAEIDVIADKAVVETAGRARVVKA
jgi:hypothetical protein